MSDKIFIQYRFTKQVGEHILNDALILSKEEFEALTPEQIESMKTERFTNWRNAVENPPVQPEVFKEDLQAQVASIDEQISNLQAQKVQVTEAIVTAKPKPVKTIEEEPVDAIKEL